jgi:hypothetical protein
MFAIVNAFEKVLNVKRRIIEIAIGQIDFFDLSVRMKLSARALSYGLPLQLLLMRMP